MLSQSNETGLQFPKFRLGNSDAALAVSRKAEECEKSGIEYPNR